MMVRDVAALLLNEFLVYSNLRELEQSQPVFTVTFQKGIQFLVSALMFPKAEGESVDLFRKMTCVHIKAEAQPCSCGDNFTQPDRFT